MSNAALLANKSDSHTAPEADIPEVYRTVGELERLVSAFEHCTLPRDEWTHRAHLTVACWYMYHHTGQEAAMRIREGIKRYNAANGVSSTPTGGYHETITLFWIFVVGKHLLLEAAGSTVLELANRIVDKYSDKGLLFEYYSRETLFSFEARAGWVEPDLRPLG